MYAQSCSTLCNPTDCSLSGSSVPGISQVRILEWVTFPTSGDLRDPGIEPSSLASPALAGGFFFFFFLPLSHLGSPKEREFSRLFVLLFLLLLFETAGEKSVMPFSHQVVSDSLQQPHVLYNSSLLCLSLFPGVCSNSWSLSW